MPPSPTDTATAPIPVRLAPATATDPTDPTAADLADLAAGAEALVGAPVADAVTWSVGVGHHAPLPGSGRTLARWEQLATVAAVDLALARVLEPHLDALAVLDEAPDRPAAAAEEDASYGVWAAEASHARLEAVRDADAPGGWRLSGRKPWCSLAGDVSHGLVTAWVGEHDRAMFSVATRQPGVVVEDGAWSAYALAEVTTSTLALDAVPATPVGPVGWYLDRPGFAWGGAGVAAVWYGGAVALARRLHRQCRTRQPDQVALVHLGAVDAALTGARSVLVTAAAEVDAGRATGADGALLAARVRQVVADAAEEVSSRLAHALGPGPLAHEARHARRVADLALYLRQHHAERDQAALGAALLDATDAADASDAATPPW
ncbi:acyl-CoA dehydrogenase [Nocardioides sp. AX2bis]|uniref:acyl-CoA dehydrogenase n=1 Tax=Nocardioides sp. AX2bis TaxID=2653157 RepID=UPI00135BC9C5|nr:acyl-CoA dehydrogenase [Nocardioides sp. AX2bis]